MGASHCWYLVGYSFQCLVCHSAVDIRKFYGVEEIVLCKVLIPSCSLCNMERKKQDKTWGEANGNFDDEEIGG